MSEATQEAEATNESPHRRLNVVPKRICTDCVHYIHAWAKGSGYYDACMTGTVVTSPVNGDETYTTLCEDKNSDGECKGFLAIDLEAVAAKEAADSFKFGLTALGVFAAIFGFIALIVIFGSPDE